jgi:hypothetical protein
VAIESTGPAEELKARFGPTREKSRAGPGAGAGAAGGALAGLESAPWSCFDGLTCLIAVPIMALIGAVSGSMEDAPAYSLTEPEQEQLVVLEGLFENVVERRTLDVEIREALVQQIPPGRLPDTSVAEGLLQLSLFDILFTRTSSGKYTLTLKTLLIAQWNLSNRHLDNGRRLYRYTTPAMSLEDWAKNDGAVLNQAFDDCVASLGEQIAADIRFSKP